MTSLWAIRLLFLGLCTMAGYAVSQVRPELTALPHSALVGIGIGFGFGGWMIALDEMLKGFSLRAFSATTFGLLLGTVVALLVDRSGIFDNTPNDVRGPIRLGLFLGFGYIGIILAMRSNKEDFSLIVPYVRFKAQNLPENLILLDTSVIIDGRIEELIESSFVEGIVVVPQFVLRELQTIADAKDPLKRIRGQHGLDMLNELRRNSRLEVKIHEADVPEEKGVDAKLLRLARTLGAKLYTNDYNLGKMAELQGIPYLNLARLALALKPVVLPGDILSLRIVREGRDKGQGVGYLPDGTMIVVNQAATQIGRQVDVTVQSLLQTGAGVIVFAELKMALAA
jgi:uncharacterized protein YacL